jgi:modulator of FtsH protease HflC
MNWGQRGPLLAGAVVAVLALLGLSLFTVSENEFAVRSSLGKMQPETYAPGLHWCWPFESIARVERRVIGQRLQGESFLTAEQQALVLDIDLNWRVRDPATFLRASAGEEKLAAGRLADALRGELKAAYAQQPLVRIIAAPHGGLSAALMARLNTVAAGLGLELLDARVQRIDPTDELANAVYANMQAAYGAQARQVRAEGAGDAERIRAEAERNRAEILASANRDAQRVRGEGDAQAAGIYARSYGSNPEFAAFYRSLQAYRTALGREGDILVIQPEGEFYKYLHSPARH